MNTGVEVQTSWRDNIQRVTQSKHQHDTDAFDLRKGDGRILCTTTLVLHAWHIYNTPSIFDT